MAGATAYQNECWARLLGHFGLAVPEMPEPIDGTWVLESAMAFVEDSEPDDGDWAGLESLAIRTE